MFLNSVPINFLFSPRLLAIYLVFLVIFAIAVLLFVICEHISDQATCDQKAYVLAYNSCNVTCLIAYLTFVYVPRCEAICLVKSEIRGTFQFTNVIELPACQIQIYSRVSQ